MTSDDTTAGVQLVLTTEADAESARRLAQELLERRVVACVTLISVHSMYHWEGEIESADEVQLLLKTAPHRLEELRRIVAELHSYDLPEFLILDARADDAYARWIGDAVTEHRTPAT